MIDSLVTTASLVGEPGTLVTGTLGVGLVGKIVWDWLKGARHNCHKADTIHAIQKDVAVIKNDVNWIKNTLSKEIP